MFKKKPGSTYLGLRKAFARIVGSSIQEGRQPRVDAPDRVQTFALDFTEQGWGYSWAILRGSPPEKTIFCHSYVRFDLKKKPNTVLTYETIQKIHVFGLLLGL